jgi:hypothetical protein
MRDLATEARADHLADDKGSDYGLGYEAGFRDASQPTSKQFVAGEFVEMRIIREAGDE